MRQKSKNALRYLLLLLTLLSFSSCRGNWDYKNANYVGSDKIATFDDAKFLFFIPVNEQQSKDTAWLYLFSFAVAFALRFSAGWSSHEIRTDIRDNEGNKIGSVGTGKYENTYISPEEASKVSYWAQLIVVCLMTCGCIISWILPMPTTGWIILTLISSIICIFYTHHNQTFYSYMQIWKWVLVAICIICLFVYHS